MKKNAASLSYLLFCLGLIFFGSACQEKSNSPSNPDATTVKITHAAGELMEGAEHFLGLPSNLAEVLKIQDTNTKCLVLGHPMKKGSKLDVVPIGLLRLSSEGKLLNIILSSPADSSLQTISARDIDEFGTVHSSSKWIIEQWFINYKGLGKTKLLGWESKDYVVKNLLK